MINCSQRKNINRQFHNFHIGKMSYISINKQQAQAMLKRIGVESIEELFSPIPREIQLNELLNLPAASDDISLQRHLRELACKNRNTQECISFLGAGSYEHYIPPVVEALSNQSAFVTAYTPYQAEASQGALQAFYEFQTMICQITGMDVCNSSMYEAGSALAEAVLVARDVTSSSKVIVPENVHPEYRRVLQSYLSSLPMQIDEIASPEGIIDIAEISNRLDDNVAALVVQQPDFFGLVNPLDKISELVKGKKTLLIVIADPISLGLLKSPGNFDVDIVVGEGQSLGIPQSFGGPYLGFFAAKEKFLRRLPGRLVGATVDDEGKRAFCLTLQTREQHIRRERATSNICSNEGLLAIRAAIYLAAVGKSGLRAAANLCFQKAHYAAKKISSIDGYELKFGTSFFKEFVIRCTKAKPAEIIEHGRKKGIFAGVQLGNWYPKLSDCLLIAVTEKRTKAEIDQLAEIFEQVEGK